MTDKELPPVLTPPECDLQDFPFMPLDVARLRDSDLASDESPEACWAAVLLWSASWHQVPAGSIPDSDTWIAKHAGYAQRGKIAREWASVRTGALRGWIKCADGRLYHPVVAEKARDAWQAKLAQRWRTECGRIKKHNERHGTNIPRPEFVQWIDAGCPHGQPLPVPSLSPETPPIVASDNRDCRQGHSGLSPGTTPNVASETTSKRQGEGQGQGQGDLNTNSVPDGTDAGGVKPGNARRSTKTPEELAKAELWMAAVSLLDGQGMPEPQARTFVGKLTKEHGDIVLEAIREAVAEQPADARAWLVAACQKASGKRAAPNKQEALEQRRHYQPFTGEA